MIYLFLVFAFVFILIIFLMLPTIPLLTDFVKIMYDQAEYILKTTPSVSREINQTITQSLASIQENREMLISFFRYSWLLLTIVVVVILFIIARRTAQAQHFA